MLTPSGCHGIYLAIKYTREVGQTDQLQPQKNEKLSLQYRQEQIGSKDEEL